MDNTKPYKLDTLGFPATDCTKCVGNGDIPAYSHNHRGVCFRCGGSGLTYPTKKIGNEAERRHHQLKAAMSISGSTDITYNRTTGEITYSRSQFTPGLIVRHEQYKRGPKGQRIPCGEWRTVATYRRTARIIGGWRAGETEGWTLEGIATFTDGTRQLIWAQNWQAQPTPSLLAEIDQAAAECRNHYDRILARRSR